MRSFIAGLASLLALSCSHPRPGLAGFEGTITLHSEEGSKVTDIAIAARGERLRIDVPSPPAPAGPPEVTLGHAVYDHATNRVLVFFDSTREYREMDLSRRIAPADATDARAPSLEPLGSSKVVAGFPCTEYSERTAEGHTTVCLAKGLPYLEIFRVKFGPRGTESTLAREYREHSTFPLELVEQNAEGKELARLRVTAVQRGPVDDSAFAIPEGYKKVDPHFGNAKPGTPSR